MTGVKGFGATTARSHDQIHTIELHVPSSAVAQVVNAMSHHPSVAHAAPAIKLSKASTPNDSDYAQQWALPKIAWDHAYGSVAINGTGFASGGSFGVTFGGTSASCNVSSASLINCTTPAPLEKQESLF